MEWTCSRCGIAATAADWKLLATIGWRNAQDSCAPVCVVCVKQQDTLADQRGAAAVGGQPSFATTPRCAPMT
jgi:hypothetical protein